MDLSQFMEMSNAHHVLLMLLETMEGGMATSMGQSQCFFKLPNHVQTLHTHQFSSYVPTLGLSKLPNHVQTLRTHQFSSYVPILDLSKLPHLLLTFVLAQELKVFLQMLMVRKVAAAKIIPLDQMIFQMDLDLSKAYLSLWDAKIPSVIVQYPFSFMHALVPNMEWQILQVARILDDHLGAIKIHWVVEMDVLNRMAAMNHQGIVMTVVHRMAIENLLVSKSLNVVKNHQGLEQDVEHQMAIENLLVSKNLNAVMNHQRLGHAVEHQMAIENLLVSKNLNVVESHQGFGQAIELQMVTENLLVSKNLDVVENHQRLGQAVERQMAIENLLVSKSLNAVENHQRLEQAVEHQMVIANQLVSKSLNVVENLKVSIMNH